MVEEILERCALYHSKVVHNKNARIYQLKQDLYVLKRQYSMASEDGNDRLMKELQLRDEEVSRLVNLCARLSEDIYGKNSLIQTYSQTVRALESAYIERTKDVQRLRKQIADAETKAAFGECHTK